MKNAFAGVNYNILYSLAGAFYLFLVFCFPFVGPFITGGLARYIFASNAGLVLLLFVDNARLHGIKVWYVVGLPAMTAVFVYILLRSTVLVLKNGAKTLACSRFGIPRPESLKTSTRQPASISELRVVISRSPAVLMASIAFSSI